MKIAVTTPTGHVGSAVADFLLDFGGDIRVKLLGRRPEKLTRLSQRGAEIVVGAQDDADFLVDATQDVDALLWVTPPGYGSDDVRAFQNRLGKAAAIAIRTNQISRVVNLSSIGAQLASGVGPISGLHDVEQRLDEVTGDITHLRPGFFFENLLQQLDAIARSNSFSLPLSGSKPFPMIATRDIAMVAAKRLADPKWSGRTIRELHGPADLSFDQVAEVLSDALGRKIVFVRCDPEEARQALLNNALSENVADLMLEMYDAADTGRLRTIQPRSAATTTPTMLAQFVHEVIVPTLAAPVTH
ncbi:MAG: NmrA family NAD(P)-binding protein [Thermoguttaceae bacterium]